MLLEGIGRPSRTKFLASFQLMFFCSSIPLRIRITFLFLAFLKCFNISFFGNFSFSVRVWCAAFVRIVLIYQKYCNIIAFFRLVVFENVKCFAFAAQSPLIFDLLLLSVYRLLSFFRVTPLFAKLSNKD